MSVNADGTFAFAWYGSSGLEVRRFSDTGDGVDAIDGSPWVATSNADGDFISVGVTGNGGLVVGWSQSAGYGNEELLAQQYDGNGNALTDSPITLATIAAGAATLSGASMSVASDGSFVVGWLTSASDDGGQTLQALQFNSSGVAQQVSPLEVASWSATTLCLRPRRFLVMVRVVSS